MLVSHFCYMFSLRTRMFHRQWAIPCESREKKWPPS